MKHGREGRTVKQSRPLQRLVSFAALIGVCITLVFSVLWFVSVSRSQAGASQFAVSDSWLPVSLTVFGRGAETVSARLTFHTPTGDLIATVERSWPGQELFLDCVVLRSGSGWLVFPFLLYTDQSSLERRKAQSLFNYYDKGGHPFIYHLVDYDRPPERSLAALFRLVRTEEWMPRFLGTLRRETVRVSDYESGREYVLFVHASGHLEWRGAP